MGYFYTQQVINKYDHVVDTNLANLELTRTLKDSVRVLRSRVDFIIGFPNGHEAEVKESIERMEKDFLLSLGNKNNKNINHAHTKTNASVKKTGTDTQLPSYDDKRFKDV